MIPVPRHPLRVLAVRALLALAGCAALAVSAQALPPQAVSDAQAPGLPDFSGLVEAVGPAVVNVRTTQTAKAARGEDEASDEERDLFRRFFGVPPPRRGAPPAGAEGQVQRGVGSGFIVSGDGHVLTNAHVVDGADEIYVRLTDKREFRARLVGADKRSDVAVLKIEADHLPSVRFGDVSRLKVGEWVIAIGSPFNLDNTVTAGIVSAKARDTGELVPLIQTDVAINPGNSGGPLINLRGEVVGINSQIYSRSGGYMGIAFAIPADEVQRIAGLLRTQGRVVRGRIGVRIGEVTKEVSDSLGLPQPAGALVRGAEPEGPAAKAGVEAGDIVTRFDGQVIDRWTDLPRFVGNTPPGSRHTLQVLRLGTLHELAVTVAELEDEAAAPGKDRPSEPAAPTGRAAGLGLKVSGLSDPDRKRLGVKGGVRVDAAQGAAARAGLKEGDVLLAVGNEAVTGAQQLEVLLAHAAPGRPLPALFQRDGLVQYAVIRQER